MATKSEHHYVIENSKLMLEWDLEKNEFYGFNPNTTALHSNKKVWWKCEKKHSWDMSPERRLKSKGCPYCLNKRVLIGYNDLGTLFPNLEKEWDYAENTTDINEYVVGSAKKVHWICSKCQCKWETTVRSRTQKNAGCPECSEKQRTANRIKTFIAKNGCVNDETLLKQWDYKRNAEIGLFPETTTPGSNKFAWWKCDVCGCSWQAKIVNRKNGRGCPACAHQGVFTGINDLCTTHPDLAKEWDYEENGDLLPQNVSYGMGKKVGWKCSVGHKYKATILHRSSGTNCPVCNSGRQTSFAEQTVYYYIKKLFPNAINRYKDIFDNGMEIDIYIPDIRYAIEYDGSFWHKSSKYDREKKKYEICQFNHIKLIRIKATKDGGFSDVMCYADDTLFLKEDDTTALQLLIQDLYFKLSNLSMPSTHPMIRWRETVETVNVERDRYKILDYRSNICDSFEYNYPQLAAEWHPTKNGDLTPNQFKSKSSFVAWWKCSKCDYEWRTSISNRSKGTGCSKCRGDNNLEDGQYNAIKIYQYTSAGTFIRGWKSIAEASRGTNINASGITACAKGKRAIAKGYRWSYEQLEELPPLVPKLKKSRKGIYGKKVTQLDLDGNIVGCFSSLNDAEEKTGIDSTSISKAIHGHINKAGGFVWKFATD